jgi:hypothetical protein
VQGKLEDATMELSCRARHVRNAVQSPATHAAQPDPSDNTASEAVVSKRVFEAISAKKTELELQVSCHD